MSLLRRRSMMRRFFAAMERIASNVGLIREAGKEFRLFSHEEVTLVRQLAESRQRLLDLRAVREEEVRQLHSIMARQLVESIHEVERRQASLVRRQEVLLQLCRQLLQERHQHQHAQHFSGAGGGGSGSGGAGGSSCKATAAGGAAEARGVARRDACGSAGSAG